MKLQIIWVGKTRERFILDGINKYVSYLKNFTDLSIRELKEEKGRNIARMIEKESERILALKTPYVLLDQEGKGFTSMEFAGMIEKGKIPTNFVIGGSYGVNNIVKEQASNILALSPLTFTHELSRIILLEQIYRAFTIIQKRGYHH